MKSKVQEIIDKLKQEGKFYQLSMEESAAINSRINQEMQEWRKDYMRREWQSIRIAEKILLD